VKGTRIREMCSNTLTEAGFYEIQEKGERSYFELRNGITKDVDLETVLTAMEKMEANNAI
jgi:hypothetical protein